VPRPSPVTDALREIVVSEDRHAWGLDELLAAVHERGQAADFSTILRAMTTLEREGVVQRVELGDGRARYESTQAHHEHIRCTSCGLVAEVPGCVVDEAAAVIRSSTGFEVDGHQVVFSGICPDCAGERSRAAHLR
jgi:Fe2+ or Zn2+ uptake regulation protein